MESMNNYWYLNKKEKKMVVHLRGGKIIQLESDRYAPMPQSELLEVVTNKLNELYPDYEFSKGEYTHELTTATFNAVNALPEFYKNSWKKAGLPNEDLENSAVIFDFSTADLANAAAKVEIYLKIGDQRVFMGDKISVIHKDKENSMQNFKEKLDLLGVTVSTELKLLTKLMDVEITRPYEACVNALNQAKIPSLAKKAYKEFSETLSCQFFDAENAFTLYSSLFGIFLSSYGEKLSEQKKFIISNELHKLVLEDWTKFDRPCVLV